MKSSHPSSGRASKVKKSVDVPAGEDGCLMGSTVLGERGQAVIPKDIRERFKLKTGARLVVMSQPGGPIVIFPLEKMQSMLSAMTRQLTEAIQ